MVSLDRLPFDNHYARLGNQFSTRLPPTPSPDPCLVSAEFAGPAPSAMIVQSVSCSS
jgi:hypothetical protein